MAETATRLESLQFNRRETGRLALALALSLALHLFVWGSYEAGKKLDVWQRMPRLAWLQPAPKAIPPVQQPEPPLEFVMVEQPSTEAPQNAKYYSSQNSHRGQSGCQSQRQRPEIKRQTKRRAQNRNRAKAGFQQTSARAQTDEPRAGAAGTAEASRRAGRFDPGQAADFAAGRRSKRRRARARFRRRSRKCSRTVRPAWR